MKNSNAIILLMKLFGTTTNAQVKTFRDPNKLLSGIQGAYHEY